MESRLVGEGGNKVEFADDRHDGPFIIFFNPNLVLSLVIKEKLKSLNIRFVCLPTMGHVTALLPKLEGERRFIVTVSDGLAELDHLIDSIDCNAVITYVVILGHHDSDTETLADLLSRGDAG